MAQGRVAHLIEWKGWGGGGVAGGRGGGWACGRGGGWGGMGAELEEDEQFYSQMTDEIKEARFAAGETVGTDLIQEKQNLVSGGKVMLESLWLLFSFDCLVQRERLTNQYRPRCPITV